MWNFRRNEHDILDKGVFNNTLIYENELSDSLHSLNSSIENENKKVRVMCLNCCGIKTRLQYPEFISLIQSNDIMCLVETKTDDIDIIDCPGYKFNMKNRRKITNKRSGGIVVGYKENLDCYIDFICTKSKYVMWFKCDEKLFNTDQPVIFGVVYIPPEYTKYSSEEAFNEIEHEFLYLSDQTNYVCLLGDFNARIWNEPDFVKFDTNERLNYDISDFVEDYTGLLDSLNISVERKSMDKSKKQIWKFTFEFL